MADEGMNFIMQDLQNHLQRAKLDLNNISTIAKNGDEKLVEKFLSESIFMKTSAGRSQGELAENKAEVLESQLYVACFWGFKDVVKGIVELSSIQGLEVNINAQNKGTRWTPLHAATFQEHGPLVMYLMQNGADPELPDAEGRTAKDFASASDKIWGHFASIGLRRTQRHDLVKMGIVKSTGDSSPPRSASGRASGRGIQMASYAGDQNYNPDSTASAAAFGGDVLANSEDSAAQRPNQPHFSIFK